MGKKKHGKRAKRGFDYGYAPDGQGMPFGGAVDAGLLRNLRGLAGSRRSDQFIFGALIGAAAVYVLGDEELRGKLIKAGMGLYANLAGGFEEMKEQMADIKAEMQAESHSAP